MKKSVIVSAFIILICSVSFSQSDDSTKKNEEFKTLFGHNRAGGAYGAFTVGYTEINDKQAVIFGGKFEWISAHSLGFGFGGNGFINEYHYDVNLGRDVFLTGGYGGIIIEPILMPNYPVHLSFPVLLGAGGISYITKETQYYHNIVEDSEAFLVAEPSAEIEINITRNFRLAFGATYKFTTRFDVGTTGTSTVGSEALEGWSYMMTFKFGRF
jgi:hypothetical protein